MRNAFEILGLPEKLDLDMSEAEAAWRQLSQSVHPDTPGGDEKKAAAINEAWNTIKSPTSRLKEWLKFYEIDIPRGANISDEMMSLFSEVGSLLGKLDQLIAEKKAASSALAKALLTGREIAAQQQLQSMIQGIAGRKQEVEAMFEQIEMALDFPKAVAVLSQLGFLEKWEQQCRERFVALATA